MKGWVGLVGWPVVDGLPTLVVTHQLQVERRTGIVRQSETDVLPLCYATNHILDYMFIYLNCMRICIYMYNMFVNSLFVIVHSEIGRQLFVSTAELCTVISLATSRSWQSSVCSHDGQACMSVVWWISDWSSRLLSHQHEVELSLITWLLPFVWLNCDCSKYQYFCACEHRVIWLICHWIYLPLFNCWLCLVYCKQTFDCIWWHNFYLDAVILPAYFSSIQV